jgi:hypothetical protein
MVVCAIAAREIGRLLGLDPTQRTILIALATMVFGLTTLPIEMSREVRPYPVMILVYSGLTATLFRLAQRSAEGRSLWCGAYALHLALLALLLWLHNMGVLYAAAVGIAFLALCLRRDWNGRDWTALIVGHLGLLLLWLPALLILSSQAPMWIKSTWLTVPPPDKLLWYITRLFVTPDVVSLLCALFLLGLAWAGLRRRNKGVRAASALAILMFVPILLAIGISMLIAPVFITRIFSAVALPASLLFALGVVIAPPAIRSGAIAALAMIMVQLVVSDVGQRQLPARQDWYGAVAWLQQRMAPGDVVFAYPNEGALPFRYAVRDRTAVIVTRPIPTDMPTLDGGPGAWNPTGSRGVFSLPPARLQEIADSPASRVIPTVWLLRLGPWAYDPGDHFLKALERSRVPVGRFAAAPIEIIGLRRKDLPPVAATEQAKP